MAGAQRTAPRVTVSSHDLIVGVLLAIAASNSIVALVMARGARRRCRSLSDHIAKRDEAFRQSADSLSALIDKLKHPR